MTTARHPDHCTLHKPQRRCQLPLPKLHHLRHTPSFETTHATHFPANRYCGDHRQYVEFQVKFKFPPAAMLIQPDRWVVAGRLRFPSGVPLTTGGVATGPSRASSVDHLLEPPLVRVGFSFSLSDLSRQRSAMNLFRN